MVDLEDMAREQDQMLRELAELGMAFAQELKARIVLVSSVKDAEAMTLAFHRVTRSVRLTLALRTRLAREHLEVGRLHRTAKERATERRKTQITAVIDREIFTEERDQDEADSLSERLVERLDQEALFDGFLEGPFEPLVERLRKDIGLPVPPPQGEGDREAVEGVEAHSDHGSGLQPPQSTASTAPPEGEQLGAAPLKPVPG